MIDKSWNNINAYINDCRQIIKRAMCSRWGYVEYEISVKLNSKFGIKQIQIPVYDDCFLTQLF